jgi:hypothetical protein
MGITVGKYHLFKRSRKSGSFYYYWFEQGNQTYQVIFMKTLY